MCASWTEWAERLVPGGAYVTQGMAALSGHQEAIRELLQHRKLPKHAWSEDRIEFFIQQLSLMDSNNFSENAGVGEREGRIYSGLVARRHFRLAHGIGRSGDIAAVQPKAAGSSVVNKLTNALVLDAVRISGVKSCAACCVVPVATGMSLMLCLLYFRRIRPSAKYVIWPRIDQKSCFKAIISSGCEPLIIQPAVEGDQLGTDLPGLTAAIEEHGAESIVAVMSTTSCFAPRVPDRLEEIALLCAKHNIPHLVNNAYGLQSSKCCHLVEQASRKGRLDVFVQSTDKNFMVPVGGSIVASCDVAVIDQIAKSYPGRASATPSLDLLVTLLSMGQLGYRDLLQKRKEVYEELKQALQICADKHGEKLLDTRGNPVSLALSLQALDRQEDAGDRDTSAITRLGSMLFTRCCSGSRVVPKGDEKSVEGHVFKGFGSHCDDYPCSYLNAAAAIGMEKGEIALFIGRLDKCLDKLKKDRLNKDTELEG